MNSKKPTLKEFCALTEEQKNKLPEAVRKDLQDQEDVVKKAEAETEESIAIKAKFSNQLSKKQEVFVLVVLDKKAWLKTVDRKILAMTQSLSGGDTVTSMELLLDALWLEGDEEIKHDDEYFIPAMGFLQQTIQVKSGYLKKY